MFLPLVIVPAILFVALVPLPKIIAVGITIIRSSGSSNPTVLSTLTVRAEYMVSLGSAADTGGAGTCPPLGIGGGGLRTFLSVTCSFLSLLSLKNFM